MNKTAAANANLDYLARAYPRGLDYVPIHIRAVTQTSIARFVGEMSSDEIHRLEHWNLEELVGSQDYQVARQALSDLIATN